MYLILMTTINASSIMIIKEWEGYVTEIGDDCMIATLIDLTNRCHVHTDEVCLWFYEFEDSEFDSDDYVEGTQFTLVHQYYVGSDGTSYCTKTIY